MGGMDKIAWLMSIHITSLTSMRDSRWDRSHPKGKHPNCQKLSKTVDWRCQSKTCWSPTVQVCVHIQTSEDILSDKSSAYIQFTDSGDDQKIFLSQMTLVCMHIWTQMKNLWSAHMRAMSTSDNNWCNFSNEDYPISYKDTSLWCAAMAIENQIEQKTKNL